MPIAIVFDGTVYCRRVDWHGLFIGLLIGWALAQKSSPVPAEKVVHYEAVIFLDGYKPGTDPSPHWGRIQRLILSKVGFHKCSFWVYEDGG
ncbi:MAG: hypothetical protein RMK19_08585 [Bacteroidia bacterium]|nr:hypothetical protein [Bacteroidia bacterium]MDW8016052.1 hypothetical protein [Bacteroidia bacterium]